MVFKFMTKHPFEQFCRGDYKLIIKMKYTRLQIENHLYYERWLIYYP